ncbi:hypothetical protein [Streptomyces sp. NPDC059378]|uniref:hypothetical protein n=1 Tax=Streptomyces sp. NPDC059378 TaxID=3346815 RepID=UPI0036B1E9B3
MTALPTPHPNECWLLEITIRAARADDTRWNQQCAALRAVSSYDPVTQTWGTRIGAFDLANLNTLQALFDAARAFGTDIRLQAAPVPSGWTGPSFVSDVEVAALLDAKADEGRPLGRLHLA